MFSRNPTDTRGGAPAPRPSRGLRPRPGRRARRAPRSRGRSAHGPRPLASGATGVEGITGALSTISVMLTGVVSLSTFTPPTGEPAGHGSLRGEKGQTVMKNRVRQAFALRAAVSLLVVAACGGDDDEASADSGGDSTISIVGFAVPEAANQAIADEWTQTPEGEGVEFKTSYGASGRPEPAVESGLEADYVRFSVASDVTRLVDADLVADTWDDGPTKGIVSSSVVVFAVRGQPRRASRPGTTWSSPASRSSRPTRRRPVRRRWNALAAYGQVIESGHEADAEAYVTKLLQQRGRPAQQRARRHGRRSSAGPATC